MAHCAAAKAWAKVEDFEMLGLDLMYREVWPLTAEIYGLEEHNGIIVHEPMDIDEEYQ